MPWQLGREGRCLLKPTAKNHSTQYSGRQLEVALKAYGFAGKPALVVGSWLLKMRIGPSRCELAPQHATRALQVLGGCWCGNDFLFRRLPRAETVESIWSKKDTGIFGRKSSAITLAAAPKTLTDNFLGAIPTPSSLDPEETSGLLVTRLATRPLGTLKETGFNPGSWAHLVPKVTSKGPSGNQK